MSGIKPGLGLVGDFLMQIRQMILALTAEVELVRFHNHQFDDLGRFFPRQTQGDLRTLPGSNRP